MVRTIVFIVIACVGIMSLLSYCASPKQQQGTLTLKPGPDFPEAHKADLGRTVARILPFCPGMSLVGKELEFTNLKEEGGATHIRFTVPDVPAIPSQWGHFDSPCDFSVEGDFLHIRGAACQAVCLGKSPDNAQDILSVDLNPKAQRAAQ